MISGTGLELAPAVVRGRGQGTQACRCGGAPEPARCAEEAGHEKWWFAEDVAKGMILYLQKRINRNTITLQELFDKISILEE